MARTAVTGQHVRDVMTFHAVTVMPDDSVKDALDLLVANNVAALPVVDEARRCDGVIPLSDLLGLVSLQPSLCTVTCETSSVDCHRCNPPATPVYLMPGLSPTSPPRSSAS
jgi:CBS-domain-containing membrane protein